MSLISKYNGNMNVIGRLLKEYREKEKISYEQLSAKLELMGISIHKQSIYDIENNKRTVKDYELNGFAKVLDVEIKDFYINTDNASEFVDFPCSPVGEYNIVSEPLSHSADLKCIHYAGEIGREADIIPGQFEGEDLNPK